MFIFIPAFSFSTFSFLLASVNSILTGIRCCTLTKFPVELSTGTLEYFAPVAAETAVTTPSNSYPPKASAFIFIFEPSFILGIWDSRKLAVTHFWPFSTIVATCCPGCRSWPSLMSLLPITPS